MKNKWNVPTFYFLKGFNKQMLFSIWVHSYYNQYLDKDKNSTCTAEFSPPPSFCGPGGQT